MWIIMSFLSVSRESASIPQAKNGLAPPQKKIIFGDHLQKPEKPIKPIFEYRFYRFYLSNRKNRKKTKTETDIISVFGLKLVSVFLTLIKFVGCWEVDSKSPTRCPLEV